MDTVGHTAPVLSKSEPNSVAEWLELDRNIGSRAGTTSRRSW